MIVISEKKLTNKEIEEYTNRGYRFAYGYESPVIKYKESVGIILETMYKSTMDLINDLLYKKHKVTIKYQDLSYTLESLDEWQITHQSDKDMLKQVTYKHPILQIYEEKRKEYFEQRTIAKRKLQYEELTEEYGVANIPNDEELDGFLKAFAHLYQVDVDYTDNLSKLKIYYQIMYYLDNDIPYANEPIGIPVTDEPMFRPEMFQTIPYEEPIDVIYIGKEVLMEDLIYKGQQDSTKIEKILQENA